jgi:signal transduction histidine kinase
MVEWRLPLAADLDPAFVDDLAAVAHITAVPKILEVLCRATGMGFSAVARVTGERWIACAVRDEIGFGLQPGGELDVRTTICEEVREQNQLIVIDHVAEDDTFCKHPTPKMYGFQSYISVPVRYPDDRFFGTLCAIDPKPARINTPEIIGMFTLFADLVGFHLSAHDKLAASEQALFDERRRAELRDQFIAVLGHDLRNPLAAIQTGARLLNVMSLGEKALRVTSIIQNSASRMAGLVDNVLDFARGKLGGGLPLDKVRTSDLPLTLDQVIAELRIAWPERAIRAEIDIAQPVVVDRDRIAQLFSNLLGNALTHGDPAAPVVVQAHTDARQFVLAVINAGPPIPADMIERLFQPFSRASERPGQQGLGLGLYIAAEIASAHNGTLDVASSEPETRFTFRMPLEP